MCKVYHSYSRAELSAYNTDFESYNPQNAPVIQLDQVKSDVNKKIELLESCNYNWYRYNGIPCILVHTQEMCNTDTRGIDAIKMRMDWIGAAFHDFYSLIPLKTINLKSLKELMKRNLIVRVLDNRARNGQNVKFVLLQERTPEWYIYSVEFINELKKKGITDELIKIV
jgi:hypothetical protein